MKKVKEDPVLSSLRDEFDYANSEYQRCIQNEENAISDYVEIAIEETNIAKKRLDLVIKKMRIYQGCS